MTSSKTRPRLTTHQTDAGVHYVSWWLDNIRSDTFVVALADTADVRWLSFADVIVGPPQRSLPAALGFTIEVLGRFTGCAVVGAGVPWRASTVRCRDGRALVCPGGGSVMDAWWAAVLAYMSVSSCG